MSVCPICKRGTIIQEVTERALDVSCSHCRHGYHITLNPSHISPCMDPRFSPPEPRVINRDPFYEFDREGDRDEKPEEEEE